MIAFGTTSPLGSVTCPVRVPRYSWAWSEMPSRSVTQVRRSNGRRRATARRVKSPFSGIAITSWREGAPEKVRAMGEASKKYGGQYIADQQRNETVQITFFANLLPKAFIWKDLFRFHNMKATDFVTYPCIGMLRGC